MSEDEPETFGARGDGFEPRGAVEGFDLDLRALSRIVTEAPVVLFGARIRGQEGLVPRWVCPNAARILGFDLEEIQRPDWWHRGVHPDDRDRVLDARRSVLEQDTVNLEYRFADASGAYRWIHAELRNVEGELPGLDLVGSWSDVTERKRLEARLRNAQKMQAVGRLAGGVAHDFNNLLTTVLGSLDLVARALDEDHPARTSLDEAARAARNGAELTGKLLRFGSRARVELGPVKMDETIRALERRIRRFLPRGVEYRAEITPGLPPALVDREHLAEAVVNLVLNARDALRGRGSIVLRTGAVEGPIPEVPLPEGRYLFVSVEDEGSGIPEEERGSIFEPFFTSREPGAGAGLGLALVHETVRECGGEVAVSSAEGEGTTVTMFLPEAEPVEEGE